MGDRNAALVLGLALAGEASTSFLCRVSVLQILSVNGGLLEYSPVWTEVGMTLPLGELSLDMVWCLLVLCLLELRWRSGGAVARLVSGESGELPGGDSLRAATPSPTSDEPGEDPGDITDVLYDPFDRPEGEVIRRAGSSSRSRSPRRA